MALAQPPIVLTWRSAATIQLRSRSVCCSIITFQAGCGVVAHFGDFVLIVSCFRKKIELGSAPQAQPPMQRHVDWSARRLGPFFSRGNVTISATTRATKVCSIVISGTCPVARKGHISRLRGVLECGRAIPARTARPRQDIESRSTPACRVLLTLQHET